MSGRFEQLFNSAPDWRSTACLNWQPDMSHGYIEGYKRAGAVPVAQIVDPGGEQDSLGKLVLRRS